MSGSLINHKISRLYELCIKIWPVEFQQKYAGTRREFNDWLNEKTGLNEDHANHREQAILNWLDELEHIAKQKG